MALSKLWASKVASDPSLLSLLIDHSVRANDRLKPVQSKAVQAILHGQDIFVSVPTGYGKSLIYQILPVHDI